VVGRVALAARLQLLRIAFQHHDHVVDGLADAGGKIAGTEGRHHIVFDDQLGVQVGQRAFQPVADLDAHLAVVLGHQQKHAIVFAALAELPETEQPVGIGLDLFAIEAGYGRHDDLVGTLFLEIGELLRQRRLGRGIDDVGIVDDTTGESRQVGGKGRKQHCDHRQQGDADDRCEAVGYWPIEGSSCHALPAPRGAAATGRTPTPRKTTTA